ncbi:hypothetical protein FOXG_16263 [Fusarium oxysporum f. sp. lycopersici 4287]|uniref:Uncharacterized protein n=2 Tax=Fusarium oxysporum TaxID=5507 RepID=A0A0J9V0Q8_FUSO4|nr:hypothetical protein FOXG_06895 [Fusarium oxysporum f. sp. lycopersici 4287]XP_018256686.1 hypothetical protein FOXG_16115 [Fusarium oxysporum f. sp. lycopersici 4287]XP_018256895.1 hypothetical protein FOXG_16263 [Fusarium oxysporum f. sp. lycopersici 4287]KNB04905.1 hypothetical protein FOXG_06895 [Fusarium oxysporum f. sp. lycopersici 4287]KNB18641.1 hypothetical protein FOXG_16115 [Fusarium oxysporum f. sp. lycopersici 4287]KNB18850.1 hypothetical protein FOXG_16263 [Fusarium oxysporum 
MICFPCISCFTITISTVTTSIHLKFCAIKPTNDHTGMSFSQQSDILWTSLMEDPCPDQADRSFDVSSTATDPTSSGYLESTQNAGQVGSGDEEVEQRNSHTQAPCSPAQETQIYSLRTHPGPGIHWKLATHHKSPNTPTAPMESDDLHLSCSQVIPCTPSEEHTVDEDRITQTDSEDEGK